MSRTHDRPQGNLDDREDLTPEDLTGIDLGDDEVIRVMVVKDTDGPRGGLSLLTGHESCATHDSVESALEFINNLYENPETALSDIDLEHPRDFRVVPRRCER